MAGQRHDRDVARPLVALQPPRRFPAVHPRQREIHQHDVGQQLARLLDRLDAVGRFRHLEARELQVGGVHFARILVVLDHEHEGVTFPGLGHRLARLRRQPQRESRTRPGSLSSSIVPPSICERRRQIESPRPVPP